MRRTLGFILFGSALLFAGPWACGGGGGSGGGGSVPTSTGSKNTTVVTTGSGTVTDLGNTCLADSDCKAPLKCILDSTDDPVFGGGPAGGYCSMACASDNDCPGNDALCLLAAQNGPGVCVQTCTRGPALMYLDDTLDSEKCHGRDDVRCAAVDTDIYACIPTCGVDSQCSNGRVCDPRTAVCVDKDKVSTGKANGAACDENATTSGCEGVCVSFTSGESLCSNTCVLGGDLTVDCGGLAKGLCTYHPSGSGAGDQGYCAPACNTHDNCQNPAFWCFAVGNLTGNGLNNGYCYGATECPKGDADCVMDKGTTCTQTKYGPFCLEPAWPLGSAAPGDAGTDGGGMDAGTDDGGMDAGTGGGMDAGTDGGGLDAGTDDAGMTDAGMTDAGTGGSGP